MNNENHALWELHEIRHRLHKRRKNKTIEEINSEALRKSAELKKERVERGSNEKLP